MQAHQVLGFKTYVEVDEQFKIGDVVKTSERCGIYLLCFVDGQYYIGQSVDVVKRFSQHQKVFDDIVGLGFKSVSNDALDEAEQSLIRRAENEGFLLRNKTFVSHVIGETQLDTILSPEEQELWLDNPTSVEVSGKRINDESQRLRYRKQFTKLQQSQYYGEVVSLLRQYVQYCVPAAQRTEGIFWSLSCLPTTTINGFSRYAVVNINQMETFVLSYERKKPQHVGAFINLSRLALFAALGSRLLFQLRYPFVKIYQTDYQPPGRDQIQLATFDFESMSKLLDNVTVLKAARVMNLSLMRKGPTLSARFHNFDLADLVV
jgi:hypothetical protein